MKKLLGILVLGLLFCSDGFAGKVVDLPKDVGFGNKYYKSLAINYKKFSNDWTIDLWVSNSKVNVPAIRKAQEMNIKE